MSTKTATLPKSFHDGVLKWKETYLPDYDFLMEHWEKHFPREPRFELCAYRELGMCTEIECGELKGKPKYNRAAEMMSCGASPCCFCSSEQVRTSSHSTRSGSARSCRRSRCGRSRMRRPT